MYAMNRGGICFQKSGFQRFSLTNEKKYGIIQIDELIWRCEMSEFVSVLIKPEDLEVIDKVIQNKFNFDILRPERAGFLVDERTKVFGWMAQQLQLELDKQDEAAKHRNCVKCGTEMVWEHPQMQGIFMESSCYIGADICHDCMTDHCSQVRCKHCPRKPRKGDCKFAYLKENFEGEEEVLIPLAVEETDFECMDGPDDEDLLVEPE